MGWLDKIIGLVFPTRCVACGRGDLLLCEECQGKLESLEEFYCIVCDRPAVGGFTHPGCATRYTPERALSGFLYSGPARELIQSLKYKRLRPLVQIMADLLIEDLEEKGIDFGKEAVVVPIPLSFWREGSRGFNQAELLGKALAEQLGLAFRTDLLQKIKDTPSQVGLPREERLKNVRGVFAAKGPLDGRDILLVDDVTTTGVTAGEAAKVLKKSGAGQVWVLAFAKD